MARRWPRRRLIFLLRANRMLLRLLWSVVRVARVKLCLLGVVAHRAAGGRVIIAFELVFEFLEHIWASSSCRGDEYCWEV